MGRRAQYWLMKSEPETFSIEDLAASPILITRPKGFSASKLFSSISAPRESMTRSTPRPFVRRMVSATKFWTERSMT